MRIATPGDAAQVLEIYAPFCVATPVSFETEAPSVDEIGRRITGALEFFPWLIALEGTRVLGYAYASRHRERAAYRWSADVSAYVREYSRGKGLGRALYTSLFAILKLQGIQNILGGITLPNPASVALHEVMGMRPIGLYKSIGYKCGAWHDVGWWQLALPARGGEPLEPLSFPSILASIECSDAIRAGLGFIKRKYS
jgi:L-amino acid N-acyltransferase YncA